MPLSSDRQVPSKTTTLHGPLSARRQSSSEHIMPTKTTKPLNRFSPRKQISNEPPIEIK
ncbi:unnamed protein product, partial [Rotaria socialis]